MPIGKRRGRFIEAFLYSLLVDVFEILPPYGRLNDRKEKEWRLYSAKVAKSEQKYYLCHNLKIKTYYI